MTIEPLPDFDREIKKSVNRPSAGNSATFFCVEQTTFEYYDANDAAIGRFEGDQVVVVCVS